MIGALLGRTIHGVWEYDGSLVESRLLLAHPQLLDPNFVKTVIYVIEHSIDGAVGVVLNRPSGLAVRDVLPELPRLDPDLVFIGGPVTPEVAIGLAPGVPSPELVDIETEHGRDAVRRVFSGYAGWTSGQLEAELEEGAWFVVDPTPSDVFHPDHVNLWQNIMRRQPADIAMWAFYPADPHLN